MNWIVVALCIATCLTMIASVLFFPKIRLGRVKISTYWVVTVIGAVAAVIAGRADVVGICKALVADTAINPVKILVLFISMTILSIFLDELGFFRYLASVALRRARTGQKRLFLYLYVTVSVLTVFTSNDVIILSFTPFICYFAKNAKIDPRPYLAAEFVAANTWSLALIIGNPTNIYLATASGIDFITYLKFSAFPTLAAGITAFATLYLTFRKKLASPISGEAETVAIEDKFLLCVGVVHLGVCTVFLAIGSYIGAEMWLVALISAISLMLFAAGAAIARKSPPRELLRCIGRSPFQLVPFVLSMFVMITVLKDAGVTEAIGNLLGNDLSILKYGAASFIFSNLINNIPMSVLFSSIIDTAGASLTAVFATIIGSNIGAFFTPIGALAGIMWSSILNDHGLKFGYADFLKMGVTIAVPTIAAALGGLWLAEVLFL